MITPDPAKALALCGEANAKRDEDPAYRAMTETLARRLIGLGRTMMAEGADRAAVVLACQAAIWAISEGLETDPRVQLN